jgi:hypothetical protein
MTRPDELWEQLTDESDDLAEELGLGRERFAPGSLRAIDAWVAERAPLGEEDAARLGFYLARLLAETHNGGVVRIREKGHPLDGEWAMSGFARGLANDYYVPFLVSAVRIGIDRSLTANEWYRQILREGR